MAMRIPVYKFDVLSVGPITGLVGKFGHSWCLDTGQKGISPYCEHSAILSFTHLHGYLWCRWCHIHCLESLWSCVQGVNQEWCGVNWFWSISTKANGVRWYGHMLSPEEWWACFEKSIWVWFQGQEEARTTKEEVKDTSGEGGQECWFGGGCLELEDGSWRDGVSC